MRKSLGQALLLVAVVAVPLAAWGCKDKTSTAPATQPAPPGGPPQGVGPGGGGTGTKQIMMKIGKVPNLDKLLKRELDADQPDWATIQPQAAEYARLTADLGKGEPAKGSKETWAKQTAAFAESAAALDRAAQGKDLAAARVARDKLGASCTECHHEHRGGPGGPGGFGPPGGRGGPPAPPPG